MDQFVIDGGVPLQGAVEPAGAKNAALPILVGSLLMERPTVLRNVPDIEDVRIMLEIFRALGARVEREQDRLEVDARGLHSWEVPRELGARIRYSLLLLGGLLGRFGKAKVPAPGGCLLGERRFDLHLKGLELMGASIEFEDECIVARADRLRGADIPLYFPTKSGTDNLMIAACRAEGTTVIRNACRYPETADLARFLNRAGARVDGGGEEVTTIVGGPSLNGGAYRIMSDRIETATFMVAAAVTGGKVTLPEAACTGLTVTVDKLREAGVRIDQSTTGVTTDRAEALRSVEVIAGPDPFINTDIVPLLTVLATLATGESRFRDLSFEDRWRFTDELARMGADIAIEPADFRFPGGQPGHQAVVRGPRALRGAAVRALDLRGGVALVLAGLAAEGRTEISNVRQIDRGYVNLETRLTRLGARMRRRA